MYIKYLKSLLWHKYYVFLAGRRLGVGLWQSIIHDWSKCLPVEFIPYAQNFFGSYQYTRDIPGGTAIYQSQQGKRFKEDVEAAFDYAWLHHQKHNPHHWQHWLLQNDEDGLNVLYMPVKYAREMVADWLGASKAYTGSWDMTAWLSKSWDKVQLHPNTAAYVQQLLTGIQNGKVYD